MRSSKRRIIRIRVRSSKGSFYILISRGSRRLVTGSLTCKQARAKGRTTTVNEEFSILRYFEMKIKFKDGFPSPPPPLFSPNIFFFFFLHHRYGVVQQLIKESKLKRITKKKKREKKEKRKRLQILSILHFTFIFSSPKQIFQRDF